MSYSQTYRYYQTQNIHNQLRLNTATGDVIQVQDDGQTFTIHIGDTPKNTWANRYALFETQNMWTFILLDQWNGKLWQVQYSVQGVEYMGSWVINDTILSSDGGVKFSITPLTSMFQYYLTNNETGEMWKFQWTTNKEDGYRWIEKIK
jgi:hypothetical protein